MTYRKKLTQEVGQNLLEYTPTGIYACLYAKRFPTAILLPQETDIQHTNTTFHAYKWALSTIYAHRRRFPTAITHIATGNLHIHLQTKGLSHLQPQTCPKHCKLVTSRVSYRLYYQKTHQQKELVDNLHTNSTKPRI